MELDESLDLAIKEKDFLTFGEKGNSMKNHLGGKINAKTWWQVYLTWHILISEKTFNQ